MKHLYKSLQNILKDRPRFDFKYLTLKCPEFIVNVFQHKPHTQLFETKHWWDNYPDVDSVKYDNNTVQYFPKFQ